MSGSDLGEPISYLVLEEGTSVLSSDGEEVGHVAHVLADEQKDVFDGIVISHGLGRHSFADADQIAAIHEHGVTLTLSAAEAESLPEPSENPAVMDEDPGESATSPLADKLRRAWDLLSGNY
ncbi:MAG TPA: PRC-barrel domain-containing protein [Solirubrobacteraceae bacterium]